MIRTKNVERGKWRTVEWFWNSTATLFFREPANAQVKIRVGFGRFGFDKQKRILNGMEYKKIKVGMESLGRSRVQVKVDKTTDITYAIEPGDVAVNFPSIEF